MTPELLALALEYGWGCPTCKGVGSFPQPCRDCHGNRITEADRAEFERRVLRERDAMRMTLGALIEADEKGYLPKSPAIRSTLVAAARRDCANLQRSDTGR